MRLGYLTIFLIAAMIIVLSPNAYAYTDFDNGGFENSNVGWGGYGYGTTASYYHSGANAGTVIATNGQYLQQNVNTQNAYGIEFYYYGFAAADTGTITYSEDDFAGVSFPIHQNVDGWVHVIIDTTSVNSDAWGHATFTINNNPSHIMIIDDCHVLGSIPDIYNFTSASLTTNKATNDTVLQVNVTRPHPDGVHESTVNYTAIDNTAYNGLDYVLESGTLNFSASDTFKLINVTIKGGFQNTGNLTFTIALSNPTNGATLGDISQTNILIIDPPHMTSSYFAAVDVLNGNDYIDHKVNWNEYNPYLNLWNNYTWEPYLIQGIYDENTPIGTNIIINITSPDNYYHNYTGNFTIWKYDGSYQVPLYQNNSSGNNVLLMGYTVDSNGERAGNISITLKNGGVILDSTTSNSDGSYYLRVHRETPENTVLKVYATNQQATLHLKSTNSIVTQLTYPDDFEYIEGGIGDINCDIIIDQVVATPVTYNYNFNGVVYTIYQNNTLTNLTTLYPGTVATIEIISCDGFLNPISIVASGTTDLNGNYNFYATLTATGTTMYMMNVSAPNYQSKSYVFAIPFNGTTKTKNWQLYPNSYGVVNPPEADFIVDTQSGMAPLTVHFQDRSTGAPTNWLWDFGDGGTSTQQNPTHTYMITGQYTVKLTVWSPYGSSGIQRNNYISTLGAITFNGYAYDYDTSAAISGAVITIINQNGATVGTSTTTGTGAYSITITPPFTTYYSLKGTKSGYEQLTYTGLMYPQMFTNGALSQDVYFFRTPVAISSPFPDTSTAPVATLSNADKQAKTKAAVDMWAANLPIIGLLLILCIIVGLFYKAGGQ